MLLIDAMYINKGGGAVLLHYLIETICNHNEGKHCFFMLDPRFKKPDVLKENYVVIPNKIPDRIKFYRQNKHRFSKVFCFANTPPPVKFKVPVYTYFHNQKVLEAAHKKFEKNYRTIFIKYLFVKLWNRNTDFYMVQTPHMVDLMLDHRLKDRDHLLTYPFYNDERYKIPSPDYESRPKDAFVFVSTPSPQKNYPTLLDAWEYLQTKGYTPELHITVDETAPQLLARIEELRSKGVKITNYSYLDPRELYFKYRYLVCPSIMESFGLPLIEAVDSGMKVLAPDLPYVYDVIKPSATFNPWNKVEMAEAVIKALQTDLPFPEVVTHNRVNELVDMLLM